VTRPPSHLPGVSVEVDWFGGLPETHLEAFKLYSKSMETSFCVFGVSLNEAIGLHDGGDVGKSLQLAPLIYGLCQRLTGLLKSVLDALLEHSRLYGTTPSVASLDSANFLGQRVQRSAVTSALWHGAQLSQRARFLSKIRTLRAMVADLDSELCAATDELLSSGAAIETAPLWAAIAARHFDLNTCLQESLISLKCFLRVLPDDELRRFQKTMSNHRAPRRRAPASTKIAPAVIGGSPEMGSRSPSNPTLSSELNLKSW
jgi:hypothetical protein